MRRIAFTQRGPLSQTVIKKSIQQIRKNNFRVYERSFRTYLPKSIKFELNKIDRDLLLIRNIRTFGEAILLKEKGFLICDIKLFESRYHEVGNLIDCSDNIYERFDYQELIDITTAELVEFLIKPELWSFKHIDIKNYRNWIDKENKWNQLLY